MTGQHQNGFRCVLYTEKDKIPLTAFRFYRFKGGTTDFTGLKPVSEGIFTIYRNLFLYDSIPLNSKILYRDPKPEDWVIEKVSFTAAYGNETMIAYLYLPKNAAPPYQTVVFFPGSYALDEKDLKNHNGSKWFIDFIIKSGRAVIYPVYKGTFERNEGNDLPSGDHQYKELLIQQVKDFSRSLDYLETRPDIDMKKLCYYGHSWGGSMGSIIPAIEGRVELSVLITGGFTNSVRLPEVNQVNYLSHVKIPVLMLNGRYDEIFEITTNVRPFFELLGSPSKDKRLCVYETGHYVSRGNMIRETLAWLDKYFGPVNQLKD